MVVFVADGGVARANAEYPSGVTVILQPTDGQIVEGGSLEVTCSVAKGSGSLEFSWCNINTRHCERCQTSNKHVQFVVKSLMENYTGSYYCAVRRPGNYYYSVSSDTVQQITVNVEHPSGVTVDLQPTDGQIVEGGSLEVTCSVAKGSGSLEFSWCNINTGHCERRQTSSKQYQFVVRPVMESYTGSYHCAVRIPGSQYSVRSDTVQITVNVEPSGVTVDMQPTDGQIVEGERLEVTCSVDKGSGSLEFSWCNVDTGHCERRQTFSKQYQFVVRRVMESYTGSYHCAVRRPGDQTSVSSDTVQITVKAELSGVTVDLQPTDGQIVEGERLEVTCSVAKGSGSLEFSWCNVDTRLCERRQTSSKQYQFVVKSAMESYTGSYYCAVRRPGNQYSVRSDTVQITVNAELPSSVTVILQPTDGQIVEGGSLEVTCSVDKGTGSLEFSWCNVDIGRCERRQTSNKQYQFVVRPVMENYTGSYHCAVRRPGNQTSVRSNTVQITVKEYEEMDSDPRDYTLQNIIRLSLSACLLIIASCFIYHHIKRDDIQPSG
ncbi:Fc receptor-like protein 2 [Discoglossus pictus]